MQRLVTCSTVLLLFCFANNHSSAATPAGVPGDGIPDLIVDGTSAVLDTNGLSLESFVLRSLGNNFSGEATLPDTFFQFNTPDEVLFSSFDRAKDITGIWDLGTLYGSIPGNGDFDAYSDDLNFYYTIYNEILLFSGNLIVISDPNIPEPSSFILATLALHGLVGYRWRRRQ